MAQPIRLPNAQEQQVLNGLIVRLITDGERPRWNAEVSAHHYLKNATLVGGHLCYVAQYQGQWLALLGWSAPARHLRPRDAWVGWSKDQLPCRRHLLANNARFCILADPHQLPNLASRALALNCARLCADWQARWGHPIVAVESFVDGQLFCGHLHQALERYRHCAIHDEYVALIIDGAWYRFRHLFSPQRVVLAVLGG